MPATIEDYRPIAARLGLKNIVVVTPHAYGSDNRCTLDAVATLGNRARAVVVVDENATDETLQSLYRAGARGIRLNLLSAGGVSPALAARTFAGLAGKLQSAKLHAQIFMKAKDIPVIADTIGGAGIPVVFDHMAVPDLKSGVNDPGFRELLALLSKGRCWVKLSGLFHIFGSDSGEDRHLIEPFIESLIAANPDQLVFGTDWPHVGRPSGYRGAGAPPAELRPSDDGRDMSTILGYVGDEKIVTKILQENPARLYGFKAQTA